MSSLPVAAAVVPTCDEREREAVREPPSNFASATSAESSRSRPGSENSLGNILDAKYTSISKLKISFKNIKCLGSKIEFTILYFYANEPLKFVASPKSIRFVDFYFY